MSLLFWYCYLIYFMAIKFFVHLLLSKFESVLMFTANNLRLLTHYSSIEDLENIGLLIELLE